ncbi:anti-sigma factor family protein [Allosphingosinicella humi]
MMRIDDEMLMAFVDGELGGPEREAVEKALRADPTLRAKLEAQRHLRARLADHYGPVASEDVPEALLAMLGAKPPTLDTQVASLGAARAKRRFGTRWRDLGAIAATLVVGVLAGQLIPHGSGPFASSDGVLVARGSLADALETQLASSQQSNQATRIGVTFADREGRFCRTFDAPEATGLACRQGGDWNVLVTAPPTSGRGAEYRQAGSSLVLEAAQDMMADAPLDASAEKAAVAAGWKTPGR